MQVAAKAIIINGAGQVLVLRESAAHATNTRAGYYQLPGGRLEPGEGFAAGLQREVQEETGLTVDALEPFEVGEWYPVIQGVPHQIVAIFMLCSARGDTQAVTLSQEHDAYMWVDASNRGQCNLMTPDDSVIDKYIARLTFAQVESSIA